MTDRIAVRAAQAADATAIAAVIAAAFDQYRDRLDPPSAAFRETSEAIARELAAGSGAILAEETGVALACVMTKQVDDDLYFGRLAVLPAARGRGLARRLVTAVETDAGRRGLAGVRLGVRIALVENQQLFAALGYVETSRAAHPGFDHPTYVTMRKPLGGPGTNTRAT
jgi:ribosomal protein S18 acetylase RimI-like enzyme